MKEVNLRKKVASSLLVQYYIFCANLFSELSNQITSSYARLALMILCVMSENGDINQVIHDPNLLLPTIDVYRDISTKLSVPPPISRPRVFECYLIDLVIHFMRMNTKKDNFQASLHILSIDLLHRILCFNTKYCQEHTELRLDYKWKDLWQFLLNFLKFLSTTKDIENEECLVVTHKTVNILNMFITYGDKFLSVQSEYNDLYYELIRCRQELRTLISQVEKFEKNERRLLDYVNLRTILIHFDEKIEAWVRQNPNNTLTTPTVLQIITSNYDTLKLKLQEHLDKYPPYVENPNAVPFFRQLLRGLITSSKNSN